MSANTNTDLRNGVNGDVGCKYPCKVASLTNIDLEGTQTINGVAVVENDIVLVTGQTDQTENGVYVVSTGQWERGVWFNNQLNVAPGSLVVTVEGSQYALTIWQTICADNPIDFGTSNITFSPNSVAASNANLLALAGLVGAANLVPYFTGPGAMSLIEKATTLVANSLVQRDANSNIVVNGLARGTSTTATAAGTTTLTVASGDYQNFTGSTTQTVVLPNATTLVNGRSFFVINNSTGVVTVNYSDGSLAGTVPSGIIGSFILISNATAIGTWAISTAAIPSATISQPGIATLPLKPSITNNSSDSAHDIDFGAYTFQSSDGLVRTSMPAQTKLADATWASGSGAGGMAATVTLSNNTFYYMFGLVSSNGTLKGYGFDDNKSATKLLATSAVTTFFGGTPTWEYLGAFRTDGSAQIRNGSYEFSGSNSYEFTYADGGTIDSTTVPGTGSRTSYALSVPPTSKAIFYTQVGTLTNPGTTYNLFLTNLNQTDQTTTPNVHWTQGANENMNFTCGPHRITANSSSQIGGRLSVAISTFSIYTKGWIEFL